MHVGGLFSQVWVRVAYLVPTFGLSGLWVACYSFGENVHAADIMIPGMRASLSTCAPLMVHLQTAWNPTTRIKEVRRANAIITDEACRRARWCCMSCSMGLYRRLRRRRATQGAASDSRGLSGTASPAPDTLSKLGTQPKLVLS